MSAGKCPAPVYEATIHGLSVCCITDALELGIHCIAVGEIPDANGRPTWHCYSTTPRLPDAQPATVRAWLDGCMAPARRKARS